MYKITINYANIHEYIIHAWIVTWHFILGLPACLKLCIKISICWTCILHAKILLGSGNIPTWDAHVVHIVVSDNRPIIIRVPLARSLYLCHLKNTAHTGCNHTASLLGQYYTLSSMHTQTHIQNVTIRCHCIQYWGGTICYQDTPMEKTVPYGIKSRTERHQYLFTLCIENGYHHIAWGYIYNS